jgi:hypothetical protein
MALSILGHPAAYVPSQRAVGAHLARDVALEALEPSAGQRFARVEHRIIGDTWRMPSSHFLTVLAEPR